jgi:hypothetical protein
VIPEVRKIRWANLKALAARYESLTAFAVATGTDVAQTRRYVVAEDNANEPLKWMGERASRRIEQALGLEEGWLDIEHGTAAGTPADYNLEGLTNLQKAVVDAVIKLSRSGELSDGDCIALLERWKGQLS